MYTDASPLLSFSQSVSFYTASSIVGRGEAGAYLKESMGGRQATPWTGRPIVSSKPILGLSGNVQLDSNLGSGWATQAYVQSCSEEPPLMYWLYASESESESESE
ncbi:hypothetical protein ILYODFUR_035365 [Ilyodon furcidens]|uniref:Uncharacterized protein n=1 Tax=Ilyodon furcidens TaxID=33524 RepID=A0ABV0VB92_9TELE